jgi:hypothetical protein
MRTTVNLREVTDRVLGLSTPTIRARPAKPRRSDRILASIMLVISATATITSLGLWIAGEGMTGLRVFAGAILLLLVMLRFRQ